MRRPFPFLAALALVITTAACGDDSATGSGDQPIRVGQIVSLTGNYAPLGTENEKWPSPKSR